MVGDWLSQVPRAFLGAISSTSRALLPPSQGAARVRWAAVALAMLGLVLTPPVSSPSIPATGLIPSPSAEFENPEAAPSLRLSSDWRRYVVGPQGRDVAARQVIRSEGVLHPEAMLTEDDRYATMSEGSLAVVDFGQVVSGKVELSLGEGSTGSVILSFSESMRFLRPGSDESRYGLGDLSYGPISAAITWTSPYRRTFRYLLIRATGNVPIDAVRLYFTPPMWPASASNGSFLSDDDQLNRLWYHGAYTLQLTTASGTATDADGTWEPVRGRLDIAASSWRSIGLSRAGDGWRDYAFGFNLTTAPGSPEEGWIFRATPAGYYLWELAQPAGGGPVELRRSSFRDGAYTSLGVKKLNLAPSGRSRLAMARCTTASIAWPTAGRPGRLTS